MAAWTIPFHAVTADAFVQNAQPPGVPDLIGPYQRQYPYESFLPDILDRLPRAQSRAQLQLDELSEGSREMLLGVRVPAL